MKQVPGHRLTKDVRQDCQKDYGDSLTYFDVDWQVCECGQFEAQSSGPTYGGPSYYDKMRRAYLEHLVVALYALQAPAVEEEVPVRWCGPKAVDDLDEDELRAMLKRVLDVRQRINNGWVTKDVDTAVLAELDAALKVDR